MTHPSTDTTRGQVHLDCHLWLTRIRNGEAVEPPDRERYGFAYETFAELYQLYKTGWLDAVETAWARAKALKPELVALEYLIPPVSPDEQLELVPMDFITECEHQKEFGDARLLARLFANRLKYDHAQEKWYLWSGHHWIMDSTDMIKQLVAGQLANQYLQATVQLQQSIVAETDPDKQERLQTLSSWLIKRACALRYHNRTKNVLKYAESLMGVDGHQWDRDPWLLGVQNGVIELKTGKFRAGKPEDFIRKFAPTEWRLGARAGRWEQFMDEIFDGDKETSHFLQRLLGYGITGLTEEHILPIFWGKGRNGKDTLLETLAAVLGPLASAGNNDLLIDQGANHAGQASPHLYDLMGKRVVWVSETREGARLNVNQIKALTGGGRITARPLYGHPVEFTPSHLIFLQTNHRPTISTSSDDYALWQRLLLVPFTVSFVANPTASDERPQDPHLREKLAAEKSGILSWLVEGCLHWQQEGLNSPTRVAAATHEYQRDEDVLQQFIDERCCVGDSCVVGATAIFQAYEVWAKENGIPAITNHLFGRRLGKKYTKKHTATGWVYLGIGLLTTS